MLWSREPRSRNNCLPELKLRIAAPAPVSFYLPQTCGGFIKGILRGVRCTKSFRVLFLHRGPPPGPLLYCTQEQYSSLMNPPLKKFYRKKIMGAEEVLQIVTILILILKSKKVIFKISYKTIRSRSRNSGLRLCGAGAERNFFSAPQHCLKQCICMGLSSFRF